MSDLVRGRRLPDSVRATAALVGLLVLLFTGVLLIRDHGDVSLLVHAGPPATDAAHAPHSLTVRASNQGYDGQFFYRLGISPFSRAHQVAGVTYDVAALRNARWLYGALAWVFSGGGHPAAVPWALLVINLAAYMALAAVAGLLARSSGHHAGWGLLIALYPGFVYTLSLDTSELLASTFLLGGFYAARRSKWWAAGVLFVLAVLTRDTTASVIVGFAIGGVVDWARGLRRARGGVAAALTGVAVFVAWQCLQRARFHSWPLSQSRKANVAGPFRGLAHQLSLDLPPHGGSAAFRLVCIVFLWGFVGFAAWRIRSSTIPLPEKVSLLPAVLVLVTLNAYLWSGATAFMRAATEAYLVSALVVVGDRHNYRKWLLAASALLWFVTAIVQIAKG